MQSNRFYEIDLLRLISAVLVVLFHYTFVGWMLDFAPQPRTEGFGEYSRYMYLGINFFFIISGFVILLSAKDGEPRKFVLSRFIRLYPAYWLCVLLTAGAAVVFSQEAFQLPWTDVLINLTMLQSGLDVPLVDGVYWTLWMELKFYALVLIMVWLRWIRFLPWFCGVVLAGSIVGLSTSLATSVATFVAGFPHWAGYFACGCVLYLIRLHGFNWGYGLLVLLSIIFCVRQNQVFAQILTDFYQVEFKAWIVAGATLLFYAFLALVALRKNGLLRDPRFYYLGVLTYPLYLLHENVGFMMFNAWHTYVSAEVLITGVLAFMLLASWLIWRWVEKPLQTWLKQKLLR